MENRKKSRELALQILFAFDAQQQSGREYAQQVINEVEPDHQIRERAIDMATHAWDARKPTDEWVTRLAPQWPTHRQPGVDRALLRLAVWEMTSTDTPPKVVIDEAIELAKRFSTENSPGFVNGVLDGVLKEVEALKGTSIVSPTNEPTTIS